MNELSDKEIEDAFAKIRTEFEERNNTKGLEMLDGLEEQWDATGSLSHRQLEWLEKQLSWNRRAVGPSRRTDAAAAVNPGPGYDGGETPDPETDIIQFPTMDPRLVRQIDAMISRKLEEPGKTVVDLKRLGELEEAIDGLKRAVRSLR